VQCDGAARALQHVEASAEADLPRHVVVHEANARGSLDAGGQEELELHVELDPLRRVDGGCEAQPLVGTVGHAEMGGESHVDLGPRICHGHGQGEKTI
jgi:hypothetical protein